MCFEEYGARVPFKFGVKKVFDMNIYDTAHRLADEIKRSDECVRLRELRERAYADDTNRVLLDEFKRLPARLLLTMPPMKILVNGWLSLGFT